MSGADRVSPAVWAAMPWRETERLRRSRLMPHPNDVGTLHSAAFSDSDLIPRRQTTPLRLPPPRPRRTATPTIRGARR
ncbi:hypothetical protein FRAHR75_1130005 [Frankia sp. Hr75.2]|nr:hypothetical protein FRAHR75_1130005 [Frankia sp. Hr75.2]